MVTRNKFQNEYPHAGATCNLHCYLALSAWCMWTDAHFYMSEKNAAIIMLKILGITIQNFIAFATRCLVFVYPWYTVLINGLVKAWAFLNASLPYDCNWNVMLNSWSSDYPLILCRCSKSSHSPAMLQRQCLKFNQWLIVNPVCGNHWLSTHIWLNDV
jgi:hypothetical protein